MIPFDDDDGDFDVGEATQAERELAPDSPGADLEAKYAEPDESELMGDVGDVDEDTLTTFLVSVVLINAGLFAGSLGVMLWYFRDMSRVGGGLLALGVLALLRTYQQYRSWKRSRDDADPSGDGPERVTAPADEPGGGAGEDDGGEGDAGDDDTGDRTDDQGAGDVGDAGDASHSPGPQR